MRQNSYKSSQPDKPFITLHIRFSNFNVSFIKKVIKACCSTGYMNKSRKISGPSNMEEDWSRPSLLCTTTVAITCFKYPNPSVVFFFDGYT